MILSIIGMIVVGFVVGALARFYPDAADLGFEMRVLLGVAGSLVGGVLTNLLWKPAEGRFHHRIGLIMSIVGAAVLIWAYLNIGR